jgi:hypothetical protein
MSQSGIINNAVIPPGAAVQTLTGDTGGAVGPDGANNINLLTGVGLTSTGNPGTNTITFTLDGGSEGTTTTVGAVTGDVITIALGATPATYTFEARISAFESTTPAGAGYQIFGAVRTTGVAATLIGTPDVIVNEEAALVTGDADLVVSANNAIFRVTGVAGLTIDWKASSLYTMVT